MKKLLVAVAILVALLVAGVAAILFLVKPDDFRPMLEAGLAQKLGRQVKIGSLSVSLLSGGLAASEVSVADDPDFSKSPFLSAQSVKLQVDLRRLVQERTVHVTGVTVESPAIFLLQSPEGKWNSSSIGVRAEADNLTPSGPVGPANVDFSVHLIRITGGQLTIGQTRGSSKPLVLEDLNVELRDFSPASPFPFTVSGKVAGSSVKLEGKAGPIDSKDASRTPVTAKIAVDGLDLSAPGVLRPDSEIRGVVGLEADGSVDGQKLKLEGRLRADRLKLAKTGPPAKRRIEANFAIDHDLTKRFGVIRKGDLNFGGARASLTGRYAKQHEAAAVRMELTGSKVALQELTEMLPSLGVVLPAGSQLQGGTATGTIAIQGPVQHLTASGPVALEKTRLTGFDLGTKMAVIQTLAGIRRAPDTDIELLSADVRTGPEGTTLDNIRLTVPGIGELTGAGAVSPDKALSFRMRATIQTSGALMQAIGQKGPTTVPFLISGTAQDPVFRPDMQTLATEKIQKLNEGGIRKAAESLLERLMGGRQKQ